MPRDGVEHVHCDRERVEWLGFWSGQLSVVSDGVRFERTTFRPEKDKCEVGVGFNRAFKLVWKVKFYGVYSFQQRVGFC